jgi:hypothetical protein
VPTALDIAHGAGMFDGATKKEYVMSRIMTCAATILCASASLLGAQQQQSGPKAAAVKVV